MRFSFRSAFLASAALIGLANGSAKAGTLYVQNFALPSGEVNITSTVGSYRIDSESGQLDLTVGPTAHGPFSTLYTWCVDLFHDLYVPGTFTAGPIATNGNGGALSGTQLNQITALIQHGDNYLANPGTLPSNYSAGETSSAIQIAIWSVENPGYSFTTDDGSENNKLHDLVAAFVSDVSGSKPAWNPSGWAYPVGISEPGGQTLAYAAVPEPASIAMLGFGVLGMVGLRRRRG